MILRWDSFFKQAVCASFTIILILFMVHSAGASSFGSLNTFGFPTMTTPGLSGSGNSDSSTTSDNTLAGLSSLTSGNGYLSASTSSVSPSNQYSGFFGTSGNGELWSGVSFTYPTATHDASSVSYASNKAYEATLGNDEVSFPDISVNLGSLSSSFPTIASGNSNVKFAESVQFQLTTESDTMPILISDFGFPSSFGSF